MNEQRFADLLEIMHRAALNATIFVDGMSFEEFLKDVRTQQAVVMSLIIIGESSAKAIAKHGELIEQFPQISWRSMRGMRNRIAHNYTDTNFEIVWQVVQEELPRLIVSLNETLKKSRS